MIASCHIRSILVAPLAFLAFCIAALPACGQDVKFLPDGTVMLTSIDMPAFLKSKACEEAKKQIQGFERGLKEAKEQMGVPIENLARMSFAVSSEDQSRAVILIETMKPVTMADIKGARKPSEFMKNFMYKEFKVGRYTFYKESYQVQFDPTEALGPPITGQAFSIVGEKLILMGDTNPVLKILERNKPTMLPPRMEAGIKQVGFSDMVTVVIDFSSMSEAQRKNIAFNLQSFVGGADAFQSVQALTVRGTAGEDVKATATLTCKDAVGAADVKKTAETGVAKLKAHLKDDKIPAEAKDIAKSVHAFLDAIKISAKEAQVSADVTVDPATAVGVMRGLFEGTTKKVEFKKGEPPTKDEKKLR
jgi:hypothetical protein